MTCALLARAPAETLNVDALIVLVSAGVAAAAAALAAVPVVVASRGRHRQREAVAGVAVLWAIVTAAAVVWAVNRDWTVSAERQRQIESGDVDPREVPTDPTQPWPLWTGLAIAYVGLVGWAIGGGGGPPLHGGRPPG